jgi:hypothetical protein
MNKSIFKINRRIQEIFYDFVQNVIDDTEDLFWDTLNKYV